MPLALPTPVARLFEVFEAAGEELYLVGGAVRDALLGTPIVDHEDLDFCTAAHPDRTIELLTGAGLHVFDVGRLFGTIGTVMDRPGGGPPYDVQITTYRCEEVYAEGSRHPEVRFGTSLVEDLARRDFSINSIAMDGAGELVDPYDGRGDLERGLLRVVARPEEIFEDDPLRMLRLARFAARLAFEVDPAAEAATVEMAQELLTVSRERWLQEWTKLLCAEHADVGLRFAERSRILSVLFPEVAAMVGSHLTAGEGVHTKDLWAHTVKVVMQVPARPAVRYAALLHDMGKVWTRTVERPEDGSRPIVRFLRHEEMGAMLAEGLLKRIRMGTADTRRTLYLVRHHQRVPAYDPNWSDAAVRRLITEAGDHLDDLMDLAGGDLTTADPEKRAAAHDRLAHLRERVATERERLASAPPTLPKGFGKLLMERFDLRPGPQLGVIRRALETRLVDGVLEAGQSSEYYLDQVATLGLVEASGAD